MKILFISIPLYPFPNKLIKRIKKVTKSNIKKSNNLETQDKIYNKYNEKKNRGNNNINNTEFLKKMFHLTWEHSKKFLKRIHFKINFLIIGVTGENAGDVAIKYGRCGTAVANLLSLWENTCSVEKGNICIYPCFWECENPIKFDLDISSHFIFILYEMMIFAKNYVKIINEKNLNDSDGV